MTSITPSPSLFINTGAQYKAQASDRLSAQVRTAVNEAKIADKPYTTEPVLPVPVEPLSRRDQRGVKLAGNQYLLDSRTAFVAMQAIKSSKVPPAAPPVDPATTKYAQPPKLPPIIDEPTDAETTKYSQPIKVRPPPIDEIAEGKSTRPTQAPPVGALIDDGGFVVTMGPDGTLICGGVPPIGPVRYPPIVEPEETTM